MEKLLINQNVENFVFDIKQNKKAQMNRLFEQCDRYKEMDVPKVHPKKSTTYMGFACANLSLAYLISKDERYLSEAKRWINGVIGYEKWGNAHLVNVDLSASFILFGLSLAYNWLYEYLNDDERKKIEDKLLLQGKIMYEFKMETNGKGWSTNYWQNHNWINMTGLATTSYALLDKYPEVNIWLEESRNNFDIVFDLFADDGSNYEGTVYFRYGVIWMLIFADLEKKHGKTNFYEKCNYLKETFYYRLYQSMPNYKEIVNFGDCHDRKSSHSLAIYYKLASEYNNGHAQRLANIVEQFVHQEQYESGIKPGVLPEAFLEVLWYDNNVKEESFDNLPLTKYFEDLGLIVKRSSWESDASLFSFKCSAPGGEKQWKKAVELYENDSVETFGLSHHHPDNNSFILFNNGAYLFIDEGYNRNIKPYDHTGIVVDDKTLKVMDCNNPYRESYFAESKNTGFNPLEFKGEITAMYDDENVTYFTGENANTYDSDLNMNTVSRTIVTTNNGYFLIVDEVDSSDLHTYKQIFHTDNEGKIENNVISYQNKLAKYSMTILSDNVVFEKDHTYVKAVMTTQEPDNYRETNMSTLIVSTKDKEKSFKFITLINEDTEKNKLEINKVSNESSIDLTITNGSNVDYFTFSGNDITLNTKNINYKVGK